MSKEVMTNIIIADDNEFFRGILEDRIKKEPGLRLEKSVENGIELYEEVLKGYADVVILDMIMPELDGIGVLEKLQDVDLPNKPYYIFFSGIDENNLIQKALSLGASYYLKKPFDLDILIERIGILCKKHKRENKILDKAVEKVMAKLGLSSKLNGYTYIKKAILMVFKNKGSMDSITKVIYPKIAAECETTDKNVERSIRNCIERAYKDNGLSKTNKLLNLHRKPTNSEFIMKLANKLMIVLRDEI